MRVFFFLPIVSMMAIINFHVTNAYSKESTPSTSIRSFLQQHWSFSNRQSDCAATAFEKELSSDQLNLVAKVLPEVLAEQGIEKRTEPFSEFEKTDALQTFLGELPRLFFTVDIISRMPPGDASGPRKPSVLELMQVGENILEYISKACGDLFVEANFASYYSIISPQKTEYFLRDSIDFDRGYFASKNGLADCIKLFRFTGGYNPKLHPSGKRIRDPKDPYDYLRVAYLTYQLYEASKKNAVQAGLTLSQTRFQHSVENEAKCRAAFDDETFQHWLLTKARSQTDEINTVTAAERSAYE